MAQKRKSVGNGRGESPSEEEEESDFELASLDDELSSEEDGEADSESEGNEAEDNEEEEDDNEESSGSENDLVNGKSSDIDGRESENLFSDVSSEYASDSDVVLDADGNPRKLLPEIIPEYDSDSSTPEEANTIGDIDVEKYYGSMPHIGYDINGRRIMRPAAGAALDQLLDTIDLPKGWTGIIDKETGELKNLTEDELEIIKRIRKEELPNDQIDVYDVLSVPRRKI